MCPLDSSYSAAYKTSPLVLPKAAWDLTGSNRSKGICVISTSVLGGFVGQYEGLISWVVAFVGRMLGG